VLARSLFDDIWGRNPVNAHSCHDAATSDPENVFYSTEKGWPVIDAEYSCAYLGTARGVLHSSANSRHYPFNPDGAFTWAEGWVTFNTAWNTAIAYEAADYTEVKVFDSGFNNEITSSSVGEIIGMQLEAPLNFDYSSVETGGVVIEDSNGSKTKVEVTEDSANDLYFKTTYQIPSGSGSWIKVSYGHGIFKEEVQITLN